MLASGLYSVLQEKKKSSSPYGDLNTNSFEDYRLTPISKCFCFTTVWDVVHAAVHGQNLNFVLEAEELNSLQGEIWWGSLT